MKQARLSYTVTVQIEATLDIIKRGDHYDIISVGHCYPPSTSEVTNAIVKNEDELAEFNAACAKVLGPLDIEEGEEK